MTRIAGQYMANGAVCTKGEKENCYIVCCCIYCLVGRTGNNSVGGGKEHMFHTHIGLWDLSVMRGVARESGANRSWFAVLIENACR